MKLIKNMAMVAVCLFAIGFVASAALAGEDEHAHGKMEMKDEITTLKGEVLDMYCYMQHPKDGQGEGHAKCANKCISRGLPIGFMSDGVVYLIIGSDHNSAAEMVAGMAGRTTEITGKLIEHDGVKAIELLSIKESS